MLGIEREKENNWGVLLTYGNCDPSLIILGPKVVGGPCFAQLLFSAASSLRYTQESLQLGPPVIREVRLKGYLLSSVAYFSRGTLPKHG